MKLAVLIVSGAVWLGLTFWPGEGFPQPGVTYFDEGEGTVEEIIKALRRNAPRTFEPEITGKPQCSRSRSASPEIPNKKPHSRVAFKVHFAFDSAALNTEARQTLNKVAQALQGESLAHSCIQVEGHTDALGSDDYNFRLSNSRAQSVVQYLAAQGVEAERLLPEGKGESDPFTDNTTEAGRQKNRRVQFGNLGYGG